MKPTSSANGPLPDSPTPAAAGARPAPQPARREVAGSVIVLVLVTVLLAAFLLTRFVERAGTELLADARAGTRERLRGEAYSALEVTLAVLADVRAIDNGLHSPAQGWDRPLEYADYTPGEGRTVEVSFEDESGKISLPKASADTLATLLESFGLEQSDAEKVTDALLVWIRTDHEPATLEAGADTYERASLPHHPAQRPLRSFGELAAIKFVREAFFDEQGQPNQLLHEFESSVSLFSFDRSNLNASPLSVMTAAGLDSGQIDGLKDYVRRQKLTQGPGYFTAMSEVSAIVGGNAPIKGFGTDVQALRVIVTVREGAALYRLSAVISPPGGAIVAPAPAAATAATAATVGPNLSSGTGSTAETAAPVIKKLDYPFKVLEIREDVESMATPPADAAEHD